MPRGVYQHKPHQGFQKGNKIAFGRKLSDETKEKIRKSRIGKSSGMKGKKLSAKARLEISERMSGSNHYRWTGENGTYRAKHKYISRIKGEPNKCEFCGTTKAKRFEWACLDHKYTRNPDKYVRLCVSCHRKFDNSLKTGSIKLLNQEQTIKQR